MPTEKTTDVSNAVGFVVMRSVEGIKVEPVVSSVDEFEGRLLMVMGVTVDGAPVLPCVDSGVGVVGAGARDFKRH